MKWLMLVLPVMLVCSQASARTWYVKPDSTGDAPTIGAAMDSAEAGDNVLVAAGTYTEATKWIPEGTAMLVMKSGVTLMGESGSDHTFLDGEDTKRLLICVDCDTNTVIDGLSIRNGQATSTPHYGGGIYCCRCSVRVISCEFVENVAEYGGAIACQDCSNLKIEDCYFYDNEASHNGGAVNLVYSPAEVSNCYFINNTAGYYGGGVRLAISDAAVTYCRFLYNHAGFGGGGVSCYDDQSAITHSTFCINEAPSGSGISFAVKSSSNVFNNIIAFGGSGAAVTCIEEAPDPALSCCDLYGNQGGDWTDCVEGQNGIDGNFSGNPLFCDIMSADFSVEDCSPCLPGQHPYGVPCGLIGSDQPGCGCGEAVEPTTWGAIKSLYR